MQLKRLTVALLLVISSVVAQDGTKSITDNVVENPRLKSISNLISANPGISKVFNEKDKQMTLLAPSDDAIQDFAFPQNAEDIEKFLRYHVIDKAAKVKDLIDQQYPHTYLTKDVDLPDDAGQVIVVEPEGSNNATLSDGLNKAKIVDGDLEAKNGFIHIIDKVLTPPNSPSETARKVDDLSTFVNTLITKDQLSIIDDAKEVTIFAPNNDAFNQLPKSTIDSDKIKDILKYHVVKGVLYSRLITNGTRSKTSEGGEVMITVEGDNISINKAKVIRTDILTDNGVMHVIDTVLDPDSPEAKQAKSSASSIEIFSNLKFNAAAFACVFAFFLLY